MKRVGGRRGQERDVRANAVRETGVGGGAHPIRPSIPPVFMVAVFYWSGCACAYTMSCGLSGLACVSYAVSFLAGALLSVSLLVKRASRPVGFAVVAVLVGASLGCAAAAKVHASMDGISEGVGFRATVTLEADSRASMSSERATAVVDDYVHPAYRASVDFPKGEEHRYGDVVQVTAKAKSIGESQRGNYWQQGVAATLQAVPLQAAGGGEEGANAPWHPLYPVLQIRSAAIDAIGDDDDAHALLQALVCGYRRSIRISPLYERFQSCGLAHLVAVSGAHLVIVTALFVSLMQALRAPRAATVTITISVMGLYLVVSGMPVSAVRAMLMTSCGLLSFVGKRRPASLNALGVGIVAIVTHDPLSSVSASFILSALSTCGIVLFAPLVQSWMPQKAHASVPFLSNALSLTLAASCMSQLYACSLFGLLPIVAPVANVVVAPIFPLCCALGLIASASTLLGLPFSGVLMGAAAAIAHVLGTLVGFLASIPYSAVPFHVETVVALVVSAGLAVLIWVFWEGIRLQHVLACLCVVFASFCVFACMGLQEDEVIMLDVGQGDAFLVKSNGATMLVDTGNRDAQLISELGKLGVMHIDYVVVTHSDDDHCGSLDALERCVQVDEVLLAEGMFDCGERACEELVAQARSCAYGVSALSYGDTIVLGDFSARVVWPVSFTDAGGNADSVCMVLEYDGDRDGETDANAFFCGDAERDELKQILANADVGAIDVLKVAHHGSKNGYYHEQLDILRPSIALISVGAGNRYGHPAPETLEMLEAVSADVYRSDENGTVRCAFAPDGIRIR